MTASHVEIPLIGKVKRPSGWLVGLLATGVVVLGSTTYLLVEQARPKLNIAELTVPVEAKDVTLNYCSDG